MLQDVALNCFNITQSYLSIDAGNVLATSGHVIRQTQEAIQTSRQYLLQDIFTRWDPFNGDISFSYNGGKDCQVLLIIYLGCLWEFFLSSIEGSQYGPQFHKFPLQQLPTVYIDQEDTFDTAQEFLQASVDRYYLSLYESAKDKKIDMPSAFESFLTVHPETEAIVIGVRHADPFGESLRPIQKTDPSWPQFYRLQPLLHWNLSQIWSFLLYSGEEMCGLYEMGFTSLGSVNNTVRNPYLRVPEPIASFTKADTKHSDFQWEIENNFRGDSKTHFNKINETDLTKIRNHDASEFHPGWYLTKDEWERAGRLAKKV
ncbi:unnamed protein product [Kluyveromyces dobzhanskii CBS 2104]|uniref:FAD synthase n=1 Tax=Kluyveromyces dobzhanskii CBS 2104 TaxID=1427455 RepID=A0A0A8L346_9SACH|nr:unnamed protein product [Kluyveromyces dobzhanskii CBS 2104]